MTVPILAQQSEDQDSFERCYNLTTATHCLATAGRSRDRLQTFNNASDWCEARNYTLLKIDNSEEEAAVKQFLQDFELTSDDVWLSAMREPHGQWTWVNGEFFGIIQSINQSILLPREA